MVTKNKMKNTEFGFIPEDWDCKKISEVAEYSTSTVGVSDFAHHHYITTENMLPNKSGILPYSGNISYPKVREYKSGDILLSNIRPYLQKIWHAPFHGGCSTDVIVLRVSNASVDSRFLFEQLCQDSFFKYVMDGAIGTKMPRGDKNHIAEYLIAIPKSKQEQLSIAETLSQLNFLISDIEKLLQKKLLMKEGAMQQLLTGKVRLKGFKEPWITIALQDIGHFNKTSINPQQYPETQFIEYSMPAYDNGKMPERKLGVEMNSNRTIIEDQCLLINKLNVRQQRIWFVNQCKENSVCSSEFLPFKSDTCDLAFIGHVMRSPKTTSDLIDMSTGTSNSQRRVSPKDLKAYSVTIPNLKEEQHEIAKILTTIDSEISALKAERDKYISIKQGMMQKLLTGQIRLPQSCLKEE